MLYLYEKQLSLFLLWNFYCGQRWLYDSSEWDWGESMGAVNKSSMDYSESSVCKCKRMGVWILPLLAGFS